MGTCATLSSITSDAVFRVDAGPLTPKSEQTTPKFGSVEDNFPFVGNGLKLGSTALRTWVYTDIGRNRERLGYLRAGALVDARGPALPNEYCSEGWYRINPRGFVCIGKGATLDVTHDTILKQASVHPIRGASLPYLYALASGSPPLFYFQLPSAQQVRHSEGLLPSQAFAQWKRLEYDARPDVAALLGTPSAPPDFLLGHGRTEKPYGVMKRLEFAVHSGRAAVASGFAMLRTMNWEGRWYGMTTEHDLVALDRVKIAVPSRFHGVELPESTSLPVGFVDRDGISLFKQQPGGNLVPEGAALIRRDGVVLTGRHLPGGLLQTFDGHWIAAEALRLLPARSEFPSFVTGDRKWIDISIQQQTLVAYLGKKAVYATLVSTGRGGMGDPEHSLATPRGTFMIFAKHVTATMDAADDAADSFSLLDVPFVQYFHKGYALHGVYWHDDFGKVRSHGCVNLAPLDAAWLFEWTDPSVPEEWHGAVNKDRGTVVFIHS